MADARALVPIKRQLTVLNLERSQLSMRLSMNLAALHGWRKNYVRLLTVKPQL